jgi:hypothetical protein
VNSPAQHSTAQASQRTIIAGRAPGFTLDFKLSFTAAAPPHAATCTLCVSAAPLHLRPHTPSKTEHSLAPNTHSKTVHTSAQNPVLTLDDFLQLFALLQCVYDWCCEVATGQVLTLRLAKLLSSLREVKDVINNLRTAAAAAAAAAAASAFRPEGTQLQAPEEWLPYPADCHGGCMSGHAPTPTCRTATGSLNSPRQPLPPAYPSQASNKEV